MGIFCSAPWTGIVLRGQFWLASPFSKQLYRLAPLWSGLVTAIAVFSTIAAGWFPKDGEPPSLRQLVSATVGAILFGVLGGLHTWKERRRQEKDALERDQQ
jgi:hypothetical protein